MNHGRYIAVIVIDDVQLAPKRVPVSGKFLLRVKCHDDTDVQLADTDMLELAINMVNQYFPADYKDFSGVEAAREAGIVLLNERPAIDRQAEVDAAATAIFDAIGALEWAEGTLENPIEYKHFMPVTAGLYYKYSKSIWKCLQSKSSCLVFPGTAPDMWEKIKNI